MAGMTDHSAGWIQEAAWNTPLTPSRFGEWLPGSGLKWDPNVVQGKGLRVGSSVDRAGRRVPLVGRGSGKIVQELASKGLGTLLECAFGTSVSTLVSAGLYQQNHSLAVTGTYLKSLTVQEGIVKPGGAVDAYTFAGCTVAGFEVDVPENGIATLGVDLDARSLATGTAYATPSYPTSPTLFSSGSPASGAMTVGGALTAPTTTVLGSIAGGTATAVRSWNLTVDNGLDTKRDNIGTRAQPTVGKRTIKLKTVVEYDAVTGTMFRDAQIGQTQMPILLLATTAEVIGAGIATAQLNLAAAYLDDGAIPMPEDGKTITTPLEWTVLDNLVTAPAILSLRTADATL